MLLHVPLDRFHVLGADGGDDVVIILSVGTANEGGTDPSDSLDFFIGGLYVGDNLVGGEGIIVVVVQAMRHDLVACIVESFDGLGVFLHPVAHYKKGSLDVISAQNINEILGVLVAPG